MPPLSHTCTKEAEIARLQTDIEHMNGKLDDHHKTLYGNGSAGMKEDLREIRQWKADKVRFEWEMRIGIYLLLVKIAFDLMAKVYTAIKPSLH
jgi:pyruvate formate-lyase activating enzyme-like uncharacterized protein